MSHCQKVTKYIPRAFIHQSSLQKLLFPLSCKRITHLPILNLHSPFLLVTFIQTSSVFQDLIYLKISHDYPYLSNQTAEPLSQKTDENRSYFTRERTVHTVHTEKKYFHISICSIEAIGSVYTQRGKKNPQTFKNP